MRQGRGGIVTFGNVTVVLALGFLGLFLVYPLGLVISTSVLDDGGHHLTLANFRQVVASGYYRASLGNSLLTGALGTLLTMLIGVPLAFCLARLRLPGRSVLLALASVPLVLPSFVSAYALVLLFGHAGIGTQALHAIGIPFGSLYGMPGIVLVYGLSLYPYVLLPTIAGFRAVDVSIEEAARNLGASRIRVVRTVLLPVVAPAVLAGALLVFVETLENFGVPSVLSEGRPFLAVDIFKLFAGEADSNPALAGALSTVLVACTALLLLLQRHYLSRRRFATSARRAAPEIVLGGAGRACAIAFGWGIVAISLLPFVAAVAISFLQFRGPVMSWRFGLGNYAALLRVSYAPLYNTLILASGAAIAATVVGAPIGYVVTRRPGRLSAILDILAMVPFAVSGTVLGIGLVIAFNSGRLVLTGGWSILILAYVVRKLPFSIRSSGAILRQIDPSLEEASMSLGVSPLGTFVRLTVPLLAGGLAGAMVLVWVTVASELSSTIVLYSTRWTTMTVSMFQALEGTAPGEAAAASAILIIFTTAPLLLIYRFRGRSEDTLL